MSKVRKITVLNKVRVADGKSAEGSENGYLVFLGQDGGAGNSSAM